MSPAPVPVGPSLVRLFHRGDPKPTGPAAELNALLDRIRLRLYPESIPVLASWWLKTVYAAGHNRAWWSKLDTQIKRALRRPSFDPAAAEALGDIQAWVRKAILTKHKAPEVQPLLKPPFRPDLSAAQAAPHLARVLNKWLPSEAARLLTAEVEMAASEEDGIPALTVARVLERLLLREHYSPASLELLLESEWFSPRYTYPADVEIFRDVVLALLGRTAAPAPPVLPAAALTGGFDDAVGRASLVSTAAGDELHVPVDQPQALALLRHDPLRIGSIVVTMDGRWWQSVRLQTGPESMIVYRPGARLRIDFTSEHARLVVPWPDTGPGGSGEVHLPGHLALFGREWRARMWEKSAEQTWLHLEFTGALTLPEAAGPDHPQPRHLRPASIEIAWSEVERALATGESDSIDHLHREDLIPLTQALQRLVNSLLRPWTSRADVERRLMSVRYLHGAVALVYGRIPWRVLSPPARAALLKRRRDPSLADLFAETFDEAPATQVKPPHAA